MVYQTKTLETLIQEVAVLLILKPNKKSALRLNDPLNDVFEQLAGDEVAVAVVCGGKPLVYTTALTWSHELFVFAFQEIFVAPVGKVMDDETIKFALASPGQRTVLQPDVGIEV